MAIQIIPRTGGAAGFGGDLGSAIGNGLSSGIQNLANAKLQKITQQHEYGKKVRGLEALGIKDADKLAHLDDETLQLVMKEKIQEPSRQAYSQSLSSLLGGDQQKIPNQQNDIPDEIRNITPEQKQELSRYLVSPEAAEQYKPEELEKIAKYLTTGEGLKPQQTNKPSSGGLNEKQATDLAKIGLDVRKMEETKKEHQEKAATEKQKIINEQNAPYVGMLNKGVALADEIEPILDQMNSLIAGGKVANSAEGAFKPKLLQNAETQEFESLGDKLATLEAQNSGVATNFKINFARRFKPNLADKPQAQLAKIENIRKRVNEIRLRNKIKDEIISENDEQQPPNIQSKINDRLETLKKTPPEVPEGARNKDRYQDDFGQTWQYIDGKFKKWEG